MTRTLSVGFLLLAYTAAGWGLTIDLLATNALRNTGFHFNGAVEVYGVNDSEDFRYTWVQWSDSSRSSQIRNGTSFIINDNSFPMNVWRPNIDNTAAWVSIGPGPDPLNHQDAWFSYYTNFVLPNTWPAWNLAITLDVWADNTPEFVGLYNSSGTLVSSVTPALPSGGGEFGYALAYDSSPSSNGLLLTGSYLLPGTYTLRFDVYNKSGPNINPSGLFVLFHSAEAVGTPEPSSVALIGTIGFALFWLRRRTAKVANK